MSKQAAQKCLLSRTSSSSVTDLPSKLNYCKVSDDFDLPFLAIEGISQKSYAAFRLFGFSNSVPSYEGTNEGIMIYSMLSCRCLSNECFCIYLLHFYCTFYIAFIGNNFQQMVFERTNVPNERMYEAMIY